MAAALSGCTLGHQKFKPTTEPLGNFQECTPFTHVFSQRAQAERVDLAKEVDGLEERALISNVCLGDKREGKRMSLGVIEFDDEGSHWDRGQLESALAEVRRISEHMIATQTGGGVSAPSAIGTEGVFLVIYVHGWRSNASEGRETLSRFRWFVSELAKRDETCFRAERRIGQHMAERGDSGGCEVRPHVLGVYVSWRGDAVGEKLRKVPGAEYLSFWNRRAAASRVAGTAMTETLLGLFDSLETWDRTRFEDWESKVERQRKAAPAPVAEHQQESEGSSDGHRNVDGGPATGSFGGRPPLRSRSLVIGHSMGARILEQAFAQAFLAKRVEARRLYGQRLHGVLEDVKVQSDSLDESKTQLASLRQHLAATERRLKVHGQAIATAEAKVAVLDQRLGGIDVPEADRARLTAYANLTKPEDDEGMTACASYSPSRMRECIGDSLDLRNLSDCAAREVMCIYESHRCSVEWLISKAPESSGTPECTLEIDLEGEIPTENEVGDWRKFEQDLEQTSSALSTMLADRWEGVPERRNPRQMEEILQDEGLFDGTTILRNTMPRWLDKMRPRVFEPITVLPPRDVTEKDEDRLLETLLTAREDIASRLNIVDAHLAAVQGDWHKLRHERDLNANKKKLQDEIRTADEKKRQAEQEEFRLGELIKSERDQRDKVSEKIAQLTEKVPFELDGALHPPGDVVLLLNAASEGMSARNLIQAMCRTQGDSMEVLKPLEDDLPGLDLVSLRRPWIVSATSRGDWATKRLFPAGVRLGRAMRRAAHRDLDSRDSMCDPELGTFSELVTKTVGHHERLFSHDVETVTSEEAKRLASEHPVRWVAFEAGGAGHVLKERSSELGTREYWVTQVPTSVIKAHGDVLTKRTLALVMGLLAYNKVFVSACPRYNHNSGECESVGAAIRAYRATTSRG